ncbi:MAG TPA: hypothetical protein PLF40_16815 [Kofleriaceae bacterium]|nr:hypothetical protein [Kofleriaceae bacterium]
MKKLGKLGLVAGLVSIALAACGSARYVQRTQYGGTIALNGDRGKAMEAATKDMQAHCPGGFQIIQEGEVPIGTDTGARSDTYQNKDGSVTQQAGQSTRTATEWRVQYQCNGAPPAPAPMGAPMGAPPPPPPPGY